MLDITCPPLPALRGAGPGSVPPRDVLADLHQLRATVASLKGQCAGETRARQAAEFDHRAAVVRADRAEHAERQVTADRDRWRHLARGLEAEVRSLRPEAVG